MPTITVHAPRGALGAPARDKLMKGLSDMLLKWEGADLANPAAQAIAWTYFNELPAEHFYVGGAPDAGARLKIDVTTPAGALDDDKREKLVAEIAGVVAEAAPDSAGRNHWVLFHEIFDGGWSSAGRIFRRADIVADVRAGAAASA